MLEKPFTDYERVAVAAEKATPTHAAARNINLKTKYVREGVKDSNRIQEGSS
jgi:hypothetical protein